MASRARFRRLVVGLALAGLVGTCDEGGGGDELRSFASTYARAVCQRIFACCPATDRALTLGFNYRDQAACVATQEGAIRERESAIKQGLAVFDPEDGRRCLGELETRACGELFSRTGVFVGCRDLLRGKGAPGAACDNTDIQCASLWCQDDVCAPGPACKRRLDCGAGQFCNVTGNSSTQTCQPARARGDACSRMDDECGPGARCLDGRCADSLADGQRCQFESDCIGMCDNRITITPEGACRPALCRGLSP